MQLHFLRGRMPNEYLWFSYFVIFLRIFRNYDAARAYHHIPRAFFWPSQAGLAEIRPRRARLTPGHSLLGPGTSRASIAAGPGYEQTVNPMGRGRVTSSPWSPRLLARGRSHLHNARTVRHRRAPCRGRSGWNDFDEVRQATAARGAVAFCSRRP